MKSIKPYFNTKPLNLYIKYILTEYDNIPLIFVVEDTLGQIYFCIRNSLTSCRWVIKKCTNLDLRDIVLHKIPIQDVFKKNTNKDVFTLITMDDNDKFKSTFMEYYRLIENNELPIQDIWLDLDFVDDAVIGQILKSS